jgi:hypothetical protein
LELEEDDRINPGSAALGIAFPYPVADEAEIQLGFQMAVEVIDWDEVLQRDSDRLVKATGCPLGDWVGRA